MFLTIKPICKDNTGTQKEADVLERNRSAVHWEKDWCPIWTHNKWKRDNKQLCWILTVETDQSSCSVITYMFKYLWSLCSTWVYKYNTFGLSQISGPFHWVSVFTKQTAFIAVWYFLLIIYFYFAPCRIFEGVAKNKTTLHATTKVNSGGGARAYLN